MQKEGYVKKPASPTTSKVTLLFAVVKNNKTISLQEVTDFFHDEFFVRTLARTMPSTIRFEAVQIRMISPRIENITLRTANFNSRGTQNPNMDPSSAKCFIFNLSSSDLAAGKSQNTIKIPYMCRQLSRWQEAKVDSQNDPIQQFKNLLNSPILIGSGIELALVIESNRRDALFRFFPVDWVSASLSG